MRTHLNSCHAVHTSPVHTMAVVCT